MIWAIEVSGRVVCLVGGRTFEAAVETAKHVMGTRNGWWMSDKPVRP